MYFQFPWTAENSCTKKGTVHAHVHIYAYANIPTCMHRHTCMHILTYIHACIWIQIDLNQLKILGCKGKIWNASKYELTDFICTDVRATCVQYAHVYVHIHTLTHTFLAICTYTGMLHILVTCLLHELSHCWMWHIHTYRTDRHRYTYTRACIYYTCMWDTHVCCKNLVTAGCDIHMRIVIVAYQLTCLLTNSHVGLWPQSMIWLYLT